MILNNSKTGETVELSVKSRFYGDDYTESILIYHFPREPDLHNPLRGQYYLNPYLYERCKQVVERYNQAENRIDEILKSRSGQMLSEAEEKFKAICCAGVHYPDEVDKIYNELKGDTNDSK